MNQITVGEKGKNRNKWFHEIKRRYHTLQYRVTDEQCQIIQAMMASERSSSAPMCARDSRELYVKCAEIVLGESTATNQEARRLAKKLERILNR